MYRGRGCAPARVCPPCSESRMYMRGFECAQLRPARELKPRQENLRRTILRSLARPHQVLTIGRKDGQDVGPVAEGDARLARAVATHQVQLVIRVAVLAGGVDDVPAVGM